MCICFKGKNTESYIQNSNLLRLRLNEEEIKYYSQIYFENAIGGTVRKENFYPLLGVLGTDISQEFAEKVFYIFSSNKVDINLCEYLKYVDIYHYGDYRERCRVTEKLMDINNKGIIDISNFKSYINIINNAVQKVNGNSNNDIMTEQNITDLFFRISGGKSYFTYNDFERIYMEKPDLMSWFDYFKNYKDDLFLIINEYFTTMMDLINKFINELLTDLSICMPTLNPQYFFHTKNLENKLFEERKKFFKNISNINFRGFNFGKYNQYYEEFKPKQEYNNNVLNSSIIEIRDSFKTISHCYQWLKENYLDSVTKKIKKKENPKITRKSLNLENIKNFKKIKNSKYLKFPQENFFIILNIIMGIQLSLRSSSNHILGKNEELTKYLTSTLYTIQTINYKEVYYIKEFAGTIFNNIRLLFGYNKEKFISSVSPQEFITELIISSSSIFEELFSTGRSGSLLYYSRDANLIVKTIPKNEHKCLKSILINYYNYIKNNPQTFITKFYGGYTLIKKDKNKKKKKIYIIIMSNVFCTEKKIDIRFDLKGSKIGRKVLKGNKNDKNIIESEMALKDIDFEDSNIQIEFGNKRPLITEQIKRDAEFLNSLGVIDYSLLLGIHYVNPPIPREPMIQQNNKYSDLEDGGIFSEKGNYIYYMGIIDILTEFGCYKKGEYIIKSIGYCSEKMSCVPPEKYKDRFIFYMNNYVFNDNGNNRPEDMYIQSMEPLHTMNNTNDIFSEYKT